MQKIKVGLLGVGKTGSEVKKILEQRKEIELFCFTSQNPPSLAQLEKLTALILFIPGETLKEYWNLLQDIKTSGICVISGCTGFIYPPHFFKDCQNKERVWISGSNFSLSMVAISKALSHLGNLNKLSSHFQYSLKETHHTHKKDHPSGTALNFKKWLGSDFENLKIESLREGDVVGIHELKIESESETILLYHKAHKRSLFAEGAVWALDYALSHRPSFGFYLFEDLVAKSLNSTP